MELAYPLFRGAGANNCAKVFVLPSFIFVVAKELVSPVSSGKRTSTRFTRGLLPHRVHYDRTRLPPPPRFFSSSLSVSVYGFFLRLRQRRSCCQFPRGRRELRRERRVLAELRRQFYFPPTSIFRTVPIPGSVDCECTAHARTLLSGYTVYSRALRYIEDIFSSE